MSLRSLYREIYGHDIEPSEEQLKELAGMMTALPDNIFNTVYQHYVLQKPVEKVAEETGRPVHLVERWVKSGVSLLRVFAEGTKNEQSC